MFVASASFSLMIRQASYTEVLGSNCIILVAFFSGMEIRSERVAIAIADGDLLRVRNPPESLD